MGNNVLQGFVEQIEHSVAMVKGEEKATTKITINGKKYSGFGEFEFNEGDKIQLVVWENGKFLNFKDPILIEKSTDGKVNAKEEDVPVKEFQSGKGLSSGGLKVKMICDDNLEKFEKAINQFNGMFKVHFTQYQMASVSDGTQYNLWHSCMIFYE